MLPDDYGHPINTITTYPALFWLHGGMRRAREGFGAARLYKEAMRAGRMTQTTKGGLKASPWEDMVLCI